MTGEPYRPETKHNQAFYISVCGRERNINDVDNVFIVESIEETVAKLALYPGAKVWGEVINVPGGKVLSCLDPGNNPFYLYEYRVVG